MGKGRSTALGRIYASLIHSGRKKLSECPKKYLADIKASYFDLYGIYPEEMEEVEDGD